MTLRPTPQTEEGISILDALVAIVLTAALIGGGVWILGSLPGGLGERMQTERNRLRLTLLWKDCRFLTREIRPDWWSDGPYVVENEGFLEIRSFDGEDSPVFILKTGEDGAVLIGDGEDERIYRFTEPPTWSLKREENGTPVGIVLELTDGLETVVFFGGRPLRCGK